MKIECLRRDGGASFRSSFLFSFLLHENCEHFDRVVAVIDPGADSLVFDCLEQRRDELLAGSGLKVMITHNLYEQLEAALALRKQFDAKIYAYGLVPEIDRPLLADQVVSVGRQALEVLYTPGDSFDGICLYSSSEQSLFSGDSGLLRISRPGGVYSTAYVEGLFKVASREVRTVYSSFDEPVTSGCAELIIRSLRNVCRSTILDDALAF